MHQSQNGNAEGSRGRLIALLQAAYSAEKAAAFAYQGHARSVKRSEERAKILAIEEEEWIHRRKVGEMLAELGAAPVAAREVIFTAIGATLRLLCPLSGWFLPMYFAGRLETMNVDEYETAARDAAASGLVAMQHELELMALVEKEHEAYFLGVIESARQEARVPRERR
ncbi:MAG: hypothetical protein ABIT01_11960 [Thermoanaerobaculia bacterium]